MNKTVYLVDEGILLTPEDEEFEDYAIVYDKKYGYYDEGQYYIRGLQVAIEDAKLYVQGGCEKTYAVVSTTILDEEVDIEEACVEDEDYLLENVVYSIAKIDGQIIENFINKRRELSLC